MYSTILFVSSGVIGYELETVGRIRKFIGVLDLSIEHLTSEQMFVSNWRPILRGQVTTSYDVIYHEHSRSGLEHSHPDFKRPYIIYFKPYYIVRSYRCVKGHPKMSTFLRVYKRYTFIDPLPLPLKCTDQHFRVPKHNVYCATI